MTRDSWRRLHSDKSRGRCFYGLSRGNRGGSGLVAIGWGRERSGRLDEETVEEAGEVALEAANDLGFGEAGGGAPRDVGPRGRVPAHASQGEQVEGPIRVPIAAAAEAVAAGLSGR